MGVRAVSMKGEGGGKRGCVCLWGEIKRIWKPAGGATLSEMKSFFGRNLSDKGQGASAGSVGQVA